MTTTTKVALGILGAAAAGVVIGLLIAPEKGSEIRTKIKKTAGEWVDTLTDLFTEGKEEMESAAEENINKVRESFS